MNFLTKNKIIKVLEKYPNKDVIHRIILNDKPNNVTIIDFTCYLHALLTIFKLYLRKKSKNRSYITLNLKFYYIVGTEKFPSNNKPLFYQFDICLRNLMKKHDHRNIKDILNCFICRDPFKFKHDTMIEIVSKDFYLNGTISLDRNSNDRNYNTLLNRYSVSGKYERVDEYFFLNGYKKKPYDIQHKLPFLKKK